MIHSIKRNGVRAALIAALMFATLALVQKSIASETDPALRDYAGATGLLNRGLNELAAQEYRKFLRAHAKHDRAPLARYGLGVALFRLQRFEEAADELKTLEAQKNFEFSAEVNLIRGQSLLALQKPAEATSAFRRIVTDHPQHAKAGEASALLVESLYRDAKHQEAQEAFAKSQERWPDHALRMRGEYFNGLAAMATENYAAAAKSLEFVTKADTKKQFGDQPSLLLAQALHRGGQAERALKQYESVVKKAEGGTLAEALYGLATLHLAKPDAKKAANYFDQLLEKFPDHRLASNARLHRARLWFEAGDYDSALAAFQRAAEERSGNEQTAYWIAKCHLRQGDYPSAVASFQEAIANYPQSQWLAEMTYDLALARMRSNDLKGAAEGLQQFSARFGSHSLAADAGYLHALVEHRRGNFAECRRLSDEFATRHPEHPNTISASFMAAECALLTDDLESAVKGFGAYLDKFPKSDQITDAKYRLGLALYRLNRLDEAQTPLSEVASARKTPEAYRPALLMLAEIAFQREQWPTAVIRIADYLSFGPEQASADDAMLKLGIAHLRQDKQDEALKAFDQLLSQFPNSSHAVHASFERGQILLARKQFDQAADAFAHVLHQDANSRFRIFALNHLAAIAVHNGAFDQASKLFGEVAQSATDADMAAEALFQRGQALLASKDFAGAAQALAELIEKNPAHARAALAQANLVIALARQARHEQALAALSQISEAQRSQFDPPLLATLFYEQAWSLRELKRDDEAIKAYESLLASCGDQPVSANAALELAELQMAAKRHENAATILSQLISSAANEGRSLDASLREQALYRLASCNYELEKLDDCASKCEQFIRDFPGSRLTGSARLMCAESYHKGKHFQKAVPHYRALIEQLPADETVPMAMLRLGDCEAGAELWSDSEKTFTEFLKQFRGHDRWYQAQFGLGWALEHQGKTDEAIAAYRSVIERHSGATAARAQFQIGECHFAKKQYDDAVRELLKVDILYSYSEWSAAALYEAGRCFEELSKPQEAQTQFEQVRQKYPDTSWAKLAAQRLTALASPTTSGG
jgi:TolA-binding protein